jgi:hypothetical protein
VHGAQGRRRSELASVTRWNGVGDDIVAVAMGCRVEWPATGDDHQPGRDVLTEDRPGWQDGFGVRAQSPHDVPVDTVPRPHITLSPGRTSCRWNRAPAPPAGAIAANPAMPVAAPPRARARIIFIFIVLLHPSKAQGRAVVAASHGDTGVRTALDAHRAINRQGGRRTSPHALPDATASGSGLQRQRSTKPDLPLVTSPPLVMSLLSESQDGGVRSPDRRRETAHHQRQISSEPASAGDPAAAGDAHSA